MKLRLEDIHTIIGWVTENHLSVLEYQDAEVRIRVGGPQMAGFDRPEPLPEGHGSFRPHAPEPETAPAPRPQPGEEPAVTAAGAGQEETEAAPAAGRDAGQTAAHVIESPLVGTFYAAPSEDAAPYVKVGDTVAAGQVVGIVEAMKLMNEIEADCDGVVEEILVQNEQMVEYGQPLMRIRASEKR